MRMPDAIDDSVDGSCVSMRLKVDGPFLPELWSHANTGEIFGRPTPMPINSLSVVE